MLDGLAGQRGKLEQVLGPRFDLSQRLHRRRDGPPGRLERTREGDSAGPGEYGGANGARQGNVNPVHFWPP